MGMQDTVLSASIPSINVATQRWHVCPVNGFIERVIAVRGSALSVPGFVTITASGSSLGVTMPSGGAAGDVDTFEFGQNDDTRIAAGEVIDVNNSGGPAETTPLNIYLVIRRL